METFAIIFQEMGTLYVVGTPIGNLEDVTLRALRILREVRLIAAEDTRRTQKLLSHYQIETPLTSYFEGNELTKLEYLLAQLGEGDVALVSKAGMPVISDPGYRLVKAVLAKDIPVVPIPGPSAITCALAVSGLPTDNFLYLGFLPRRKGKRRKLLGSLTTERATLVAFEAPHRLRSCLQDIGEILGDRQVALARELTKLHEEVLRGRVSEMEAHFRETPPRGEFTLVIEGWGEVREREWGDDRMREALAQLLAEGIERKRAVRLLAKLSGHPRREIYEASLPLDQMEAKEGSGEND